MRSRYLRWVTIHMKSRIAPPNGVDHTWAGYSLEKSCSGKSVPRDALASLPESLDNIFTDRDKSASIT